MEPILEVERLSKSYKGFRLKEVSFSLPRGYIMGLIGPNGAGKTTTIKLIMNLIHRDGGTVRVCGMDNLAEEIAVKGRIGIVLDEPAFYEDVSIRDLKTAIAPFYSDWDEQLFQQLVRQFELPLEKKYKKLSQGMKTKFALALALAHRPDLLILDEPTAGLDPVFRRHLLSLLQSQLSDGQRSILFSTHITSDLDQVADYITFIRDGAVVFSTSKAELEEKWGVIRGGPEVLNGIAVSQFEGIKRSEFSFQALTRDVERLRRSLPPDVVIDKASLEEIMVLSGKGVDRA